MDSGGTTVRIFGQEYSIRSDGDPEYVRRIAHYVDEKMHQVASKSAQVSSVRVAILAALNIADELFQAREGGAPGDLDARARELAANLEAMIEELDVPTDPESGNNTPKS